MASTRTDDSSPFWGCEFLFVLEFSAPPKIEKLRGTEVHTKKDHPTDGLVFFAKRAQAQQHREADVV